MICHLVLKSFLVCLLLTRYVRGSEELIQTTANKKLAIYFQVGVDEYVSTDDAHFETLLIQHKLLEDVIKETEKNYPNSIYGVAQHGTSPYTNGCGYVSELKNYSEFIMPDIILRQPFQEKDSCLLYSSVLSTLLLVRNKFSINTELTLENSDEYHKIIIAMTNYWDDWFDPDRHGKCASPMPETVKQALDNEYISLGMIVTQDVFCPWENIYVDMNLSTIFLEVFDPNKYTENILKLIKKIVLLNHFEKKEDVEVPDGIFTGGDMSSFKSFNHYWFLLLLPFIFL